MEAYYAKKIWGQRTPTFWGARSPQTPRVGLAQFEHPLFFCPVTPLQLAVIFQIDIVISAQSISSTIDGSIIISLPISNDISRNIYLQFVDNKNGVVNKLTRIVTQRDLDNLTLSTDIALETAIGSLRIYSGKQKSH